MIDSAIINTADGTGQFKRIPAVNVHIGLHRKIRKVW